MGNSTGPRLQTKSAQLRSDLLDLAENHLSSDAPLPSERLLMSRYGVSRATVRAAIAQLVSEGKLYTLHGKGTFVAPPRVQSSLHMASFTEDMRRRGLDPASLVRSAREEEPDDATRAALKLRPGDTTWRIERLRLAGGTPMALEIGHYPSRLLPGLLRKDLSSSLYQLLGMEYHVGVDSAEQQVWAEAADKAKGELLQVSPGAPLMVFRRTSSADATRVEYVTSWYRADRYQLHMILAR